MNESPQQHFLTQAGAWIDLYGPHWRASSNIPAIAYSVKKLPDSSLDLIKHLALHIGWLWRYYPAIFTPQAPDLVTPPDNISDLEGTQYDKAVLEILIDKCARLPRQESTGYCTAYGSEYMTDINFLYAPTISDDMLIESIVIYSSILLHEDESGQILPELVILLSDAWELYLRAWERANA